MKYGDEIMEFKLKSVNEKESCLSLLSYGRETCSSDKQCLNVKRPRYILHFVSYGKGFLRYGGEQEFVLGRGDVFLLYANEVYSYEPDKKDPWTYSWMTIDGENLDELFGECGFTKEHPYIRLNEFESVVNNLEKLTDTYGGDIAHEFERSAYMLLIFSKMIQQNKKKKHTEELKFAKRRSFRTAVSYIRDNYMIDLDIYKIASAVFLSESYLKHLFKEMVNMSVTEFLNRYRISKACSLFKQSAELNDAQIAQKVGYSNYTYFIRVFNKYCGMSPREYKKAERTEDPFTWVKGSMLMVFDKDEIDWLS